MGKDSKKKKGNKSDEKLHISDVRKRIVVDPEKVIKTKPIMIKEGWGNLFG